MLWAASASAQIPREYAGQEPDGGGSVYVFNCCAEAVTGLALNDSAAGGIAPSAGYGDQPMLYTPSGLQVPRSQNPTALPQFVLGDNPLEIAWESVTGFTTVTIPGPNGGQVGLDDDLILFIAFNSAMLMATRAYLLATFQISLQESRE
jgi:hypothetical protein